MALIHGPNLPFATFKAGGGGLMVFSWCLLDLLIPIAHQLYATAYLSIVADHSFVYTFMATIYQ